MVDVAVVGAGISGMATALRLRAYGLSTILFEAHSHPGGCAGFYRRRDFSFDVGATTLVDFGPHGVGGELLESIGISSLDCETLSGYTAWLPDRTVTLYRDPALWSIERLRKLGYTPAHHRLWALLDYLAEVFWQASRRGIKLPLRTPGDFLAAISALNPVHIPLARYLPWTLGDALRSFNLHRDKALVGLLSMLVEDTVHSTLDDAPLINSALGVTIRGAGLMRHRGGMRGFWRQLVSRYRAMGGVLHLGCAVEKIEGRLGDFRLHTRLGDFAADQVVSAVSASLTAQIAPPVAKALAPYLERDRDAEGGAIVVFLGVPDAEVDGQRFTHHQLLQSYDQPLGSGNNMFISVSAPGDTESAPAGCRAIMISTHCELEAWRSPIDYEAQKQAVGDRLVQLARRVYPCLGENAVVYEIATPRTYEKFTRRPDGAVGGVRQTLANSNQNAVSHDLGPAGFWMVGDSTWPGLGTVACVLGSRIVAEGVLRLARRAKKYPIYGRSYDTQS